MAKFGKLTTEEFIKRAIAKYGEDAYSYDEVDYQGCFVEVKIHCNSCGTDFWIKPSNFLDGTECRCKHGYTYGKEAFVAKAIKIYGPDAYDFTDSNYVTRNTILNIKCNTCGNTFEATPNTFYRGNGCPHCNNPNFITTEKFIKIVEGIYGPGVFDFSKAEYQGTDSMVEITYLETKETFLIRAGRLTSGRWNPSKRESKGESQVRQALGELNLSFDQEYIIKNKINSRQSKTVRIDFRLVLNSGKEVWIEYNGKQHYKFFRSFYNRSSSTNPENAFLRQLERDRNVREYCKTNDILLVEIPYTYNRYDKLKGILEEILMNGKSPEDLIVYPKIDDICTN